MAEMIQIRANEEVQRKFRDFAKELNMSQGEAINHMMTAFKIDSIAQKIPEQKGILEQFQTLTNTLNNMYLVAIQNTDNQKAILEEIVKETLLSKDAIIINLQKELEEVKLYIKIL